MPSQGSFPDIVAGPAFSRLLLDWNKKNNQRKMPWKGVKDPYKIWLSEVILQQTRVEQGLKYYQQFLKAFPTIDKLAQASDQRVYKLWEGLGYYSRCKNLLSTARKIVQEHNGEFPSVYDEIIKLKGIGAYTASAIASFAFELPYAVVDGNVFRVLSRVFGISRPIDLPEGKKYFTDLASKLLDKKQPGIYNQAIMDFGATVCKPLPECSVCPFSKICRARLSHSIDQLPVKSKKQAVRQRWFYYIVPEFENRLGINQRAEKDIWQNLFQFSLVESGKQLREGQVLKQAEKKKIIHKNEYRLLTVSEDFQQRLSHQLICGKFFRIKLNDQYKPDEKTRWVSKAGIKKFAFPGFINQFLKQEGIV